MTVLTALFPVGAFYGQGSPANVITDDSAAVKRTGFKEYGLTPIYSCAYFISYRVYGDGYSVLVTNYIKMIGNF